VIAFHPSQRFNPMETPHRKLVISSTPGSARRTTRGHCVTPSPDNWEVVIGISEFDCLLVARRLFWNRQPQLCRITQARTGMMSSPRSSVIGKTDIVDNRRTEDVGPSTIEVLAPREQYGVIRVRRISSSQGTGYSSNLVGVGCPRPGSIVLKRSVIVDKAEVELILR
jgi:hypothetical protein